MSTEKFSRVDVLYLGHWLQLEMSTEKFSGVDVLYLGHWVHNCAVRVKVTQSCPLFGTPWIIQSMEFSRPGSWSG